MSKNPFTRAISGKADSRDEKISEAADAIRRRNTEDELAQPENESSGESDVPSAVTDNEGSSDASAGSDFGLGVFDYQSGKEKLDPSILPDDAQTLAVDPMRARVQSAAATGLGASESASQT